MTEQKCVRTYDREGYKEKSGCEELISYLEKGWYVVFITSKEGYTEYIIEREVDTSIKTSIKEIEE